VEKLLVGSKKLLMMLTIFQNAEDEETQNSSTLLCCDFSLYPTEYRKLTESSGRFFVLKKEVSKVFFSKPDVSQNHSL